MKYVKSIVVILLTILSFGQNGMGFTGDIYEPLGAEIQPAHHNDPESLPPASAYLLNASAQAETILHHSNRLSPQFSESNVNEEEFRDRVKEEKAKREGKACLIGAEIIKRSLTFRELIYPHHFYF